MSSSGCSRQTGVPPLLVGLATDGNGQTMSLSSSAQNGRIDSNKYHCRSALSPFGEMASGSSSVSKQMLGSLRSASFVSVDSMVAFTKIFPGEEADILK